MKPSRIGQLLITGSLVLASALAHAANGETVATQPVGQAPEEQPRPATVVLSDRSVRGVLTPKGSFVVEPSVTYSHATSTSVAIEGFTIIPALVVGLINVSEVQRDTFTSAIALRYGLTERIEVEAYLPYVYRTEDTRQREILDGSPADVIRESDGNGLGDIELSARYQISSGLDGGPIFIGGLRVKSRSGDGPFDVDRQEFFNDDGVRVGEVYAEQPTGSGFWGVQPSLTMVYTTDPAVLYGNVNYTWNAERDISEVGTVDPGDSIGGSVGLGFAINERTSFSVGYEHAVVLKAEVEGDSGLEPVFDHFQVGSFLLGFSHRLSPTSSVNLSIAIGATDAASDVQIALRMPMSF